MRKCLTLSMHIEKSRRLIKVRFTENVMLMYVRFARILVIYKADGMGEIFQALRETWVKLQRNEAMWDGQGIIIVFSLAIS